MTNVVGATLTEVYTSLIRAMKDYGERVGNTVELRNVTVKLLNPRSRYINEPVRKHSVKYMRAEMRWYLAGGYEIEEIGKHASLWAMVSDDGKTVNSNYGMKIFREKMDDGRTQFETVVAELQRDPLSRRAIMFPLLPSREYHKMSTTKDFPCTQVLQFMIRGEKLDGMSYMRSNDLIFGFSNDIPFFTVVQEMVARALQLPMGEFTHYAASLHVYDRHRQKMKTEAFDWEVGDVFPPIIDPYLVLDMNPAEAFVSYIMGDRFLCRGCDKIFGVGQGGFEVTYEVLCEDCKDWAEAYPPIPRIKHVKPKRKSVPLRARNAGQKP